MSCSPSSHDTTSTTFGPFSQNRDDKNYKRIKCPHITHEQVDNWFTKKVATKSPALSRRQDARTSIESKTTQALLLRSANRNRSIRWLLGDRNNRRALLRRGRDICTWSGGRGGCRLGKIICVCFVSTSRLPEGEPGDASMHESCYKPAGDSSAHSREGVPDNRMGFCDGDDG